MSLGFFAARKVDRLNLRHHLLPLFRLSTRVKAAFGAGLGSRVKYLLFAL
jgi:hypothetical protein